MPDVCVVKKKYIPQEALKRWIEMIRRKLVQVGRREGGNEGKVERKEA